MAYRDRTLHKDAATLEQILDKNSFEGTLVSDNAAVYQGFTSSQKCWAHLLRKAIKLTLGDPANQQYRQLADRLLLIYRDAKKAAGDGRLGDAGRKQRVAALDDQVVECCLNGWTNSDVGGTGTENDYHRLCNELMKLMIDRELFVFVEQPNVSGTNNASERQLRDDALARKTGRTNKTPNGARRQSIISSVLQSIGKQLEVFQLQTVIDEVARWTAVGQTCFDAMSDMMSDVMRSKLSPDKLPDKSGILDRIILNADT
jgi:transposase